MPKAGEGAATLKFDYAIQHKAEKDGSGYDPVELVVVVKDGEDVKTFDVPVTAPEAGTPIAWIPVELYLKGVAINEGTEIIIRNSDKLWGEGDGKANKGVARWYLDNVTVDTDPEVAVEAEAGLKADLLDVVFNEDGTATDKSGTIAIETVGTPKVSYNDRFGRNVATFDEGWNKTLANFYRASYEDNADFKAALADGHSLEMLVCAADNGMYTADFEETEFKPFASTQSGGTSLMVCKQTSNPDKTKVLTFCLNDGAWKFTCSKTKVEAGKYYHVIGVWNKEEGKARVYVNGVLEGEIDCTGEFKHASAGSQWFGIGADPSKQNATNSWNGEVAIARVYSNPLTAADVETLYGEVAEGINLKEGTAENPYKIYSAEDLCDMHNKIVAGERVYFALQNDIDMKDVKDYVPVIGSTGVYEGEFEFDGQNHVISNFAPDPKDYYYMSLFGVIRGNVKNLGVEDCNIVSAVQGTGVLGGYGSQGGVDCVIENVWATGRVESQKGYVGGLVGTNGNNLTLRNCYFNGDVISSTYAGGLVGRARAGLTIENAYAAGTVTGTTQAGGIAGTDKSGLTVAMKNVIAWNTAVNADVVVPVTSLDYDAAQVMVWDGMTLNGAPVEGGVAVEELQAAATSWEGFNSELSLGMPVLAWQTPVKPYIISTPEDLAGLSTYFTVVKGFAVIEFAEDIDMEGVAYDSPVGVKAHIDGKGHVIKNLKALALLKNFEGSIKNLGIENAITTGTTAWNFWDPAGAFLTYANGNTTIENCFATGTVTGFYAGGLVGGANVGATLTVKNCYANIDVLSTAHAGGLVGSVQPNATLFVENCYSAGTVNGTSTGGGLVGGANLGYPGPRTIEVNNCAVLTSTIAAATASASVVVNSDSASVITSKIVDVIVSDKTLVNDEDVEGAVAEASVKQTVTTWDAFAKSLVEDMPVLAWQVTTPVSVENVTISNNGPVEFYNLQGIRMNADAMTPGIYIRRQGNVASKVVIR